MIEHAVYASARSQQRDGYQVVARSPGVAAEDTCELAVWCPSHDGLFDATGGTPSVNAFRLPSGAHCVARSFAADAEYSGRGGMHVVTHAFVLSPDDYLRFGNNPFAVLQAAVAAGKATSEVPKGALLAPFSLVGRTRAFDRALVRQIVGRYSLQRFSHALDVSLQAETVILATEDGAAQLMAALLNCLPVRLRPGFSLATGLVYSARRPYQWMAHPADFMSLRRLERSTEVRVVNLAGPTSNSNSSATLGEAIHAWAAFVHACLAGEDYTELERQMRNMECVEDVAELDCQAAEVLAPLTQVG